MQQTFYIDGEEEITSIISRLRKSPTQENVLVIPQRALVLQSVVNLKLLRKEAEDLQKNIVIVTQDKQGALLADKSGIPVKSTFDGLQKEGALKEDLRPMIDGDNDTQFFENESASPRRNSLIGSENFFDPRSEKAAESPLGIDVLSSASGMFLRGENQNKPAEPDHQLVGATLPGDRGRETERIVNKELMRFDDKKTDSKKVKNEKETGMKNLSDVFPRWKNTGSISEIGKESIPNHALSDYKEKELKSFFGKGAEIKRPALKANFNAEGGSDDSSVGKTTSPSRLRKGVVFLVVALILGVGGYGAYAYLPKTNIVVHMKIKTQNIDFEATGQTSSQEINAFSKIIPLKRMTKSGNRSMSFDATGKNSASDQKAKGKVTIYNEFSSATQQLVATTRLVTEDGKIYRLVRGVVVPGTTQLGSETKPGVIEADVIADQAGEEYNIGPAEMRIAGFEGGPKYEKFYAKSIKPIVGGGSKEKELSVVSKEDIQKAKGKVEQSLEEELKEEIKKEAGDGFVVLPDAVKISFSASLSSLEAGAASSSFDYQAKGTADALVFSLEDMRKMINDAWRPEMDIKKSLTLNDMEYQELKADFEKGELKMKVSGVLETRSDIDLNKFRSQVLGKKSSEIEDTLKQYPQIDNMDVEFWPGFFFQRVSGFPGRVGIRVQEDK